MTIKLEAINVNPGAPYLTISKYEWRVDGVLNSSTSSNILVIDSLSAGSHEILLRIQNSCGSWSNTYSKIINISGDKMEKTITVVVDQPVMQAKIVLDFTATIEVTVADQLERPISGASINLDDTPTGLTTGADGKVSIPNVPYGTHTVKGIK